MKNLKITLNNCNTATTEQSKKITGDYMMMAAAWDTVYKYLQQSGMKPNSVEQCKKNFSGIENVINYLNNTIKEQKLLNRINSYAGKYQISMQLWGEDENQIFIQKDDVALWDCGNEKTPSHAMKKALKYLDRINRLTP